MRRKVITHAASKTSAIGQTFHAEFFNEAFADIAIPVGVIIFAPGTRIALIGGDQVSAACYVVGINSVRLIHSQYAGPSANIDGIVLVAGIDAVTRAAMIFVAQRKNVGNGSAGDIHFGQGVVFLQTDPRGAAVSGNSYVLRLDVLSYAGIRSEYAYASGL